MTNKTTGAIYAEICALEDSSGQLYPDEIERLALLRAALRAGGEDRKK